MNKKHKGSMMLEVLVALMILMIGAMMIMTSVIATNKFKIKRDMYEKIDRVSYSIMNEIKYNYSYDEIIEKMKIYNNGDKSIKILKFKYTDNILEKLIKTSGTTKNLFSLESGEEIKLEILSGEIIKWEVSEGKVITGDIEKNRVQMKLSINIHTGGGVVSNEREFNKSWWMEQ